MEEGLKESNVTSWEGRPKRTRKPAPLTYWEEFVETDAWYRRKLLEDIPPEEMHAALYDENFEADEESGEESSDDDEILEEEGEEDESYEADSAAGDNEASSEGGEKEYTTPEGKRRG